MGNYPYKKLGIGLGREFRNNYNENMDSIEGDVKRIDENSLQAVKLSLKAGNKSETALQKSQESNAFFREVKNVSDKAQRDATLALTKAESSYLQSQNTQAQVNTLGVEARESSTQVLQALTNLDGETFDTLKEVLDAKDEKIKILSSFQITLADFPRLDGEVDDTKRIQRAIEHAKSKGTFRIYFPKGIYIVTSFIKVYSNMELYGDGYNTILDGSNIPAGTELNQSNLFKVEGTTGVSTIINEYVNSATSSITVSDANPFSKGDLVIVTSDEVYTPGTANELLKKGEIHVIREVSGTTITMSDNFFFSYDNTKNAKIQKVKPIENTIIRYMKIRMGGIGSTHSAISCNYTRNVLIQNVEIDGAEDAGIWTFNSFSLSIKKCIISNSTSPTSIGNTGYGIAVIGTTRNILIEENTFFNCRHGVTGGGSRPSILVNVFKNKAYGCTINFPFDCHEPCLYWVFRHNTASGCKGGIIARGQYITIEENDIINSTDQGIRVESYTAVTNQFRNIIRNNRIKKASGYGINIDGYQSRMRETLIEGNVIDETKGYGIRLTNFRSASISRNSVLNTSGVGIYVGGSGSTKSVDLVMNDNSVNYSNLSSILLENVDRANLNINKVRGSTTKQCLSILNCNEVQVNGGVYREGFLYGIYLSGGVKHQINDIRCSITSDTNGDGIRCVSITDLIINGGLIDNNPRFGIYVSESNYVIIRGVNARDNGRSPKILVDSTAVNKIVDGNIM
ncbi:right-handed parallel beta-helix repeat-containing protein [Priestia endophytica]|uniref:right-handed parallel beta-helix repeat-containing protein n=1 Tax=Priestia endophytica TaxID=135735 RepID=UPI003D2B44C6